MDRTAPGASLRPARWRWGPRNTLHALIRRAHEPKLPSGRDAAPAEVAFGSAARTRRTPSFGRKGVHADAIGMAMAAEARRLRGRARERGGRRSGTRTWLVRARGVRREGPRAGISASRRSVTSVDTRGRNRPEICCVYVVGTRAIVRGRLGLSRATAARLAIFDPDGRELWWAIVAARHAPACLVAAAVRRLLRRLKTSDDVEMCAPLKRRSEAPLRSQVGAGPPRRSAPQTGT